MDFTGQPQKGDAANGWFYNLGRTVKLLNRHHDGEKHMAIFSSVYQEHEQ